MYLIAKSEGCPALLAGDLTANLMACKMVYCLIFMKNTYCNDKEIHDSLAGLVCAAVMDIWGMFR